MPESFGARMRQRREEQQIALLTIAEQTKIKLSLLEALERDDLSRWPSGIFRRAFIRAYAHAIGLEPDVIVREFLEIYPDPVEVIDAIPGALAIAAGAQSAMPSGGPPTRFHYLVGTAIDSLARLGRKRAGGEEPATMPAQAPAPSTPFAPEVQTVEPLRAAAAAIEPPPIITEQLPIVEDKAPAVEEHTSPAEAAPSRRPTSIESAPPIAPKMFEPDLLAAASLCTELARIEDARDAAPLLEEAAALLDALGLIVWAWDPQAMELTPALAHGYSDRVLAQLPRVRRDADNATAAAFRSAQTCVVNGSDLTSGALVVPLLTPGGCAGVLAIELEHRNTQNASVRALITIFAAQLARLVGAAQPATAAGRRLA